MTTPLYNPASLPKPKYFIIFWGFVLLLYAAIAPRLSHTYLEDDLLWMLPLVDHILKKNLPLGELFKAFHHHELTLFDGAYMAVMLKMFGSQVKHYVHLLFAFHVLNSYLLYFLLYRRMQLKWETSFWAGFIFLTYYGHFHSYTWPISSHHLICITYILLILNLYLKTDALHKAGGRWIKYYLLTLLACLAASFMRLSIVILPVIIVGHIIYSDKELKNVSMRYLLWVPALIILPLYQLLVLALSDSHGNVLKDFFKPLSFLLEDKGFKAAGIVVGGLIVFVFLIWGMLRLVEHFSLRQKLSQMIEKGKYLLLFFPHLFVVAMASWVGAYFSAKELDPLLRWHLIVTPEPAIVYWVWMAIAFMMYVYFLKYTQHFNRHLIVFAVWFMCLQPYLLNTMQGVFSRYIAYYSVFLSCLLSLVVFEWLPGRVRFFQGQRGRFIIIFAILILSVVNIFAIHVRLQKSFLADYYWSYDYIKFGNLIKSDMKNTPELKAFNALCIDNITPVTYWDQWRRSFLGSTDIDDFAPFRFVMKIILGEEVSVKVNACEGEKLRYLATDKTLIRNDVYWVEPFYHHMSLGLIDLGRINDEPALGHLSKAVGHKPFVHKLYADLNYFSGLSPQSVVGQAQLFRRFYYLFFNDDPKSLYVENLVRNESLDWAVSVFLLGFLQHKMSDNQASLTGAVAAQVLGQKDLRLFPFLNYLLDKERMPELKPRLKEEVPAQKVPQAVEVERYKGYAFYWFPEKYFAINADDYFDVSFFKAGIYNRSFSANTRHALRSAIDGLDVLLPVVAADVPYVSEYKGFVIKRQDNGRFFARKLIEGGVFFFECLSLNEAKIIIDEYLAL